jgi:sigma-54 dependent transcriptional regulator, flagellar regulatory protein
MKKSERPISPILGESASIKNLKMTIEMVAPSSLPVLITGPTGAGKELVAQELHRLSERKGPLVAVNCAAIPNELLESELFGFERGAFTGADRQRIGRFEQSAGGTLFLDEIGDMPLVLQSKLLRAVEKQAIQRLGGSKDIDLDLRIVCATHKDLSKLVADGQFRADLYYRLAVFPIGVPALSERLEDIPLILNMIVEEHSAKNPKFMQPIFSESALNVLKNHDWPGNVRELRNVIERAFIMFHGKEISAEHMRNNLLRLNPNMNLASESLDSLWEATADMGLSLDKFDIEENAPPPGPDKFRSWFKHYALIDLRSYLRDIEIVFIEGAIEANEQVISRAADALGLRRTTLIEKMKKYGIERFEES